MEPLDTFQVEDLEVRIMPDEDPQNPREDENLGRMICAHKRYRLGDEQVDSSTCSGWDEVSAKIEKEHPGAVLLPLYLLDHSGLILRTHAFNDPWDSGLVGFAYMAQETIDADCPPGIDPKEWAVKVLEAEVQEYSSFLEGAICGWIIAGPSGLVLDSQWGYCDADLCRTEARRAAEGLAEERRARGIVCDGGITWVPTTQARDRYVAQKTEYEGDNAPALVICGRPFVLEAIQQYPVEGLGLVEIPSGSGRYYTVRLVPAPLVG